MRLESVEREMEAKTREMSKVPSPRHDEMNTELEALRQARDHLRVECSELQSKTSDDLADDESRRYSANFTTFTLSYCYILQLIPL